MNKSSSSKNSLTKPDDWGNYYSKRGYEHIEKSAQKPSIIESFLQKKNGKIFELGCGQSQTLARSATLGWEVGGIDFNSGALKSLKTYVKKRDLSTNDLIEGDVFNFDTTSLTNKYDLLVSFGFLEHFKEPQEILTKWVDVLHDDGVVISVIPNLFSINAPLLRKFDPVLWEQHIQYTPKEMDRFHKKAGLNATNNAIYTGKYDIHTLIPWDRIEEKINNFFIFKAIKYLNYYGVGKLLQLLPDKNMKLLNSYIIGIYSKT